MSFRTRTPVPPSGTTWEIQVGSQHTRYRTVAKVDRAGQAFLTYTGYHVHSGGKKRLLRNGKVVHRHLTSSTGAEKVEQLADSLF